MVIHPDSETELIEILIDFNGRQQGLEEIFLIDFS